VTVRLNPDGIVLQTDTGARFPLLTKLKTLRQTGATAAWNAQVPYPGQASVGVRLCVIRKSKAAIALAHKKLHRKASKQGSQLQPETLVYAEYVMVLTTFPEAEFPTGAVLQFYRFRWQIELVFKRFKQIAQLGHIPKHDPESAKAWLYGKLNPQVGCRFGPPETTSWEMSPAWCRGTQPRVPRSFHPGVALPPTSGTSRR
jgi:hypothetical protein